MRSSEEITEAVRVWAKAMERVFDEDFGLCLLPEDLEGYSVARWGSRLGPAAGPRGYHGVAWDSSYYGLALLRLGEDVERARKILGRVLEAQVRDEASPLYGRFKLVYEAKGDDVLDGNTTFFVCLALIPAVKEYPHLLGEELVREVKDALSLIPPREYQPRRGVGYTNACLGELAIELAICELLGDGERLEVGRRHFDRFYEVNMTRGFPERLSAPYYVVDLAALGMIIRYVKDPHLRTRAREMLAVFAQELLFFEERQPIPARRTYNQHIGAALKWSILDWVLGSLPCAAADLANVVETRSRRGFEYAGEWLVPCELLVGPVLDPARFCLPAPRQMRGRHVDENGYTSYFHKDFTLGTFDRWPPLTVRVQHESDIPVAFAGASADLVYFGAYSVDAEGNLQTHPGTGQVATPSKTSLPRLMYAACQEANVCCLLSNITGFACALRQYGWMLRGLQYKGRLFDSEGRELTGEGMVESQWVFLVTDEYFAGVYPLSHFDPTQDDLFKASETSLRYAFRNAGLDIFAPNFQADPPVELKGKNLPAGAVLVLGSARDTDLAAFRAGCLESRIHDEWRLDGYCSRADYRDCERRVGLDAPGGSLRLAFDYLADRVVLRSFNGRAKDPPAELSGIRLGISPWVYRDAHGAPPQCAAEPG